MESKFISNLFLLCYRELPTPIFNEKMFLLLKKGASIAALNSDTREALPCFQEALDSLSQAQFKILKHLMFHLGKVAGKSKETGMSSKNLAIVWAPNLIRTPLNLAQEHSLIQTNLVLNTQIVQYLIDNAKWLFEARKKSAEKNNNQLPPQFLEKVKFINVGEEKPVSLSKRYKIQFYRAKYLIFETDFEALKKPKSEMDIKDESVFWGCSV